MRVNAFSLLGLALLVGCSSQSDATMEPGEALGERTPVGGLSIVAEFPDTPEKVTLGPNPTLIDDDTSASASLDIGYGPALAGDWRFREAGLQFADMTTEVNLLRVWTDRLLPPDVFQTYSWSVFRSDDNLFWVQVPVIITLQGVSSSFADIRVASTSARYLKVVTRPLPARITSDPRYAEVFVTELQAFLTVP
jgi:hypothetical protein